MLKTIQNEKFFTSTLNPPSRNCAKRILKLGQIHKLSSHKYRVTPDLATVETPFFLVYGRDPHLPFHQLLELMQWVLGDPESGLLNLKAHCLALVIAKKTLDENCFRTAQKTTDREPPSFKIGDRVYLKSKQPGKWDLIWRPGYWIVCIEHDGHYLHIKIRLWKNKVMQHQGCSTWTTSRIMEHRCTILQSWKIHQPSCKFANYHTLQLKMKNFIHVNNLHSSSFQHIMHDCAHQYNNMGEQRISTVQASI